MLKLDPEFKTSKVIWHWTDQAANKGCLASFGRDGAFCLICKRTGQLDSCYVASTVKLSFRMWKEIELSWVQNMNCYSDNSCLNGNARSVHGGRRCSITALAGWNGQGCSCTECSAPSLGCAGKGGSEKALARRLLSLALDLCGLHLHLPLRPPRVHHSLQRSNWFNRFGLFKGWDKRDG